MEVSDRHGITTEKVTPGHMVQLVDGKLVISASWKRISTTG